MVSNKHSFFTMPCISRLNMQWCHIVNILSADSMITHSGVHRKFSWLALHSVPYGGYLYLVCAVCDVTIWRHIPVSKPTFWRSSL